MELYSGNSSVMAGVTPQKVKASLVAGLLLLGTTPQVGAFYLQSFETDDSGWSGATRVPTTTHGVATKVGAFHAETGDFAYTFWGGESRSFPPRGYTTSVDVYLDISAPYMDGAQYANDTRFDWSSAIGTPECAHRRDFVFNTGFYTDTDFTGTGPRFVISASNNAGRGGAFPKNPGRNPCPITVEGWYTFEHRFRDNGAGVLAVDMTIKNALGVPVCSWTLSDPSDVIGETVGGNQYGLFISEFPQLAFDTSILLGFQDYCSPANTEGRATGGGQVAGQDPLFSPLGELLSLPALIASPNNPNSKCTFGFNVRCCAPAGNLEYNDHENDVRIKALSIDAFVIGAGTCGAGTHATFSGTARVTRSSGSIVERFTVEIDDCGEPGTADMFGIATESYVNGPSPLIGGNIQIRPE